MSILHRSRIAASALALVGLLHSQATMAQQCIAAEDASDAIIYALPIVVDGFVTQCAPHLADDGFYVTRGEEFLAPYQAVRADRWPGTLRFLVALASEGKGAGDAAEAMAIQPEDTLRSFVDAVIAEKLGGEIKPSDCGRIEKAMELLAPLPPENLGGLVTILFEAIKVRTLQFCEVDKP